MGFDPGAASLPSSGLYGLPYTIEEARVVVVPVPFAATTSYGSGAERGPRAILEASKQVDLYDGETGRPYEAGIAMLPIPDDILRWHEEARAEAEPVIAAAGIIAGDPALQAALARANAMGERTNERVYSTCRDLLAAGKLIGLVGGDHSTPFGAIRAIAETHPGLGILHVDAHADLRDAYEGFVWSHASIMHNVLARIPGVARLVQVGIRDFSEDELTAIRGSAGRVQTHFDHAIAARRLDGEPWSRQITRMIEALPDEVYVSFDIDGLDPTLCPHTGTPVPGGLSFHEATALIAAVARSGRKIVGVDVNEVVPGPDGDQWDGNVGARILYKLLGWMLVSQGLSAPPA